MDSKFVLYDVISSMKNMTVNYSYSLNEASSPFLYDEYMNQFTKISKITKDLFYLAYEKGWYNLEAAPNTKITKEINKLKNELKEVKCPK